MALHRISHHRRRPLLTVTRAFSSFPNPPFPPPPPQADDPDAARSPPRGPGGPPDRLSSSIFQDIRQRLRSSPTPPPPRRIPANPPRPNSATPQQLPSTEELRKMLETFRGPRAATGAAPSQSVPGATPSFQDLFKNSTGMGVNAANRVAGFESIRQSLKSGVQPQKPLPFLSSTSHRIFSKEKMESNAGEGKEDKDGVIALTGSYSFEELGERLGKLRPAGTGKDGKEWFSLEELQGRIAKLVKMERQEDVHGIKQSIASAARLGEAAKAARMQTPMSWLANIGQMSQPDYIGTAPQEELLERYFHPDHMSSEEKMKLELQRVRDEFKMSENDCGSVRVQIAQLSLKIKHLSSVLHKKDKHSRKGLHEMIERRKKYLKYLRRTDWDSYCLVLSKLGLRDVPEYKAPDYKSKSTTKDAKSKKSKSKKKKKMQA